MKIGMEYPKKPNLVITTAKFIPNLAIMIIYINKITHILTRGKILPYSCYADNLLFLVNGIMTFGMDFVTFR